MKAIIYKGLEVKPSDEIKLKQGLLAPQLKHLGEYFAISSGRKCEENYCVKENDIITVRVYAGASVAVAVAVTVGVGLVAAAVVGVVGYIGVMQARIKKASQYKSLNRKVESLPYLAGAENQLATGQTQPQIIGEHLFTPYFLDYPINKISGTDGKDQYTYRVYELGFGKQVIKEIKAGGASLIKLSGTTPQTGKYNLDATSTLYDSASFIEISQGGVFTTPEFNKKYYHAESGASVPKKKDGIQGELNFEMPRNSKYIELAILFNGLIGYNDEGNKTSRMVEVIPQYSLDGSTWITFNFSGATNNVFSRMTQEQIRFTARKTFTYAEIKNQSKVIKVRLLCPTVKYEQQGYDDCYCVYTQAELFDEVESKKANAFVDEKRIPDKQRLLSTRLGVMIKATEDNQDKLSKINVVTQGVAPTPSNWNAKVPTSNPASWLVEVLASDTHPLSAIDTNELDLESFEELYDYCDDNELEVNMVLMDSKPKSQVIESILSLCNSVLFKNLSGKIQVATDKINNQPIALFTSQNIISTTIDKSFERKSDGLLINYTDSSLGYESASYLVMKDGQSETPQSVISTIQADGITKYEQIVKHGRKLLAVESLRPKTVKVQTSLEGVFYAPLSKVLLQTEALKTGKGNGEIKKVIVNDNNYITHLELYDDFIFTENETNIILVSLNRFNNNFSHVVVNFEIVSANKKTIKLVTPILSSDINGPKQGDTFAYGISAEPVISEMIIAGVEENANGYTLTLVDYNEAIYDSGEIPEYKPSWASDIGDKPPATLPPLTLGDVQTYVELEAPDTPTITAIAQKNSLKLSASVQDGAKNGIAKIEWSLKKDDTYEQIGISSSAEFVYGLDDYYEAADFATWRVKAKVFNANSKGTESLPVTINTDTYGTWILNQPTVTNSTSKRSVILQLSTASGSREQYSTIQYRVQVQKAGEENWWKPDLVSDPYADEDNYKDGEGYETVANTFIQSVPMESQEAGIKTTAYNYRIVGVSVETQEESEPTIITATATASTAMDIYDESIGVEKLAVKDLSAISGTFGDIKSDEIEKDATNYWILSKSNSSLGYGRAGEFCVGTTASVEPFDPVTNPTGYKDSDEFLHYLPSKTGSTLKGLFLKLANFIVDAIASTIRGRFRVRGSTATMKQAALIVNPESTPDPETNTPANTTDIKTAVRCPAGVTADVTGNLTGNADTATIASTATTASKANVRVSLRHGTTFFTKTWAGEMWSGLINFRGSNVWTEGENTYYSYRTEQYVLDKSTSTWVAKTWTGLTDFVGRDVWTDGENVYYSQGASHQYVLNKSTSTWTAKTWSGITLAYFFGSYIWTAGDSIYHSNGASHQYVLNKKTSRWNAMTWSGLTSFYGSNVWKDGENIYYSEGTRQYKLWGSSSIWNAKTWSGLTSFYGSDVWTDGVNTYYSNGTSHHTLNKSTSTWTAKTWGVLTDFFGRNIWTDGKNTYYSSGALNQYALNKVASTWVAKTWSAAADFYGYDIWTDGENIYYSNGALQRVLDKSTSTWVTKTWSGLTDFDANNIWTDGENIYYSESITQYVLNKATSTWTSKTWNGLISFSSGSIWTDGENIYYSNGTNQYVLNKSTSTWSKKTWKGLTDFYGFYIWTDGENVYYSYVATHYVLNKTTSTWSKKTWSGMTSFYGSEIWTDGENIYYSYQGTNRVLNKTTSSWSTKKTWNGMTGFEARRIWTDGENIYFSSNTTHYILPATRHNYVDDNKYNSLFGTVTSCNLKTLSARFVFSNE